MRAEYDALEADADQLTAEALIRRTARPLSNEPLITPSGDHPTLSSVTDALHLKVHRGTLAERPFELLARPSATGAPSAPAKPTRAGSPCPPGYRTDFAWIPRLVWSAAMGAPAEAAVIFFFHRMAADIFNEALAVLGEPAWRRAIMVWAVKWFGPKFRAGA